MMVFPVMKAIVVGFVKERWFPSYPLDMCDDIIQTFLNI